MKEKVRVQGKKKTVTIDKSQYIGKGGEASVFEVGDTLFKIYEDPAHTIPAAKITELQVLEHPNIFIPKELVLDMKGTPIGFTMRKANGNFFTRLYSNGFWRKQKITPRNISTIFDRTKELLNFIHKNKCLVVDMNDMNILLGGNYDIPLFIDVDSYQTESFSCSALNPVVKDWMNPDNRDELTDFFSFAIIMCQAYIGIHPFRGKHPDFDEVEPVTDIRKRMEAGVSIFNTNTQLPPKTRDLTSIPTAHKQWFIELFEQGKRTFPPMKSGEIVQQITRVLTQSTDTFIITPIGKFESDIIKVFEDRQSHMIVTTEASTQLPNSKKIPYQPGSEIFFTPVMMIPIGVYITNSRLQLINLVDDSIIPTPDLYVSDFIKYRQEIYLLSGSSLWRLATTEFPNGKIVVTLGEKWSIMPRSSKAFDGFLYQDIVGHCHLSILLGTNNRQYAIKELDNVRVIDGKHDGGVVVIVGKEGNVFKKARIILSKTDNSYHIEMSDHVDLPTINFVARPNGSCIMINDDGSMDIFVIDHTNPTTKTIKDPDINVSMSLAFVNPKLLFFKERRLYSLTSK